MNTKSNPISHMLVDHYLKLFPSEAVGLLNELSAKEILALLQSEPIAIVHPVFSRLDPDIAAKMITIMDDQFFRALFSAIEPGDGAKILSRLDQNTIRTRLSLLPEKTATEFRELLSYPPDTAGSLMDPNVTFYHPGDTVEKALKKIRTLGDVRIINLNMVDDEQKLVGIIRLQEVAVSAPKQRLGELNRRPPIAVEAFTPKDDIIQLLDENKLLTLPVVDIKGKLIGVIRNETLVSAAKQDASEDMQAMFGAGRTERALSGVLFSVKKRLPWLEINLLTAFIAASVVGLFEDTIAKITILAVFLPVVAGQSGNTGSQALAVTMRGLALREIRLRHWFRVARKEILVGLVNGFAVAFSTAIVVYFWGDSPGLSLVIGIAMIFSMVIAGFSGALIPILLTAFKQDPAQSSSIILTTVTDVAGFLSFLGLATLLAGMLSIG